MSKSAPRSVNSKGPEKSRQAGVAAGLAFACLLASMGCLNLSFGGKSTQPDESAVVPQSSKISIPAGQVVQVYYPVPYASPPNLVLDRPCDILEQKADHFLLKNNNLSPVVVTWTARGVTAAAPTAPSQPESAPTPVTATVTTQR